MGHATHFLQRLERLSTRHLDFALELYRNSDLIRFILDHTRLPDGAERVALAVEERANGPHIIVARDGGFVTCLGEDMSIRELPVIARSHVEHLSKRYEFLNGAFEQALERGEMKRLYSSLLRNGPAFSREDFLTMSAIVPIAEADLVETICQMAEYATDFQIRFRPARYRRLNKSAVDELYGYWMTWWALGHLVTLCGTMGRDLGDLGHSSNPEEKATISHALSQVGMPSGMLPIMLRSAWTAARAGRKLVSLFKKALQEAGASMALIHSALPLVVIGLRHRSAHGEVQKLLKRSVRRIEDAMPEVPDREFSMALLKAWESMFEPNARDELCAEHRDLGAHLVQCWGTESLPEGHPGRFESKEDVPDELAFAMPVNMQSDLYHDRNALMCMSYVLPWVAEADAAQFYLPARWVNAYSEPWNPEIPLAQLTAFSDNFVREPVVRNQPKPGRNQPCPCGSGKKYKRCCIHKQ